MDRKTVLVVEDDPGARAGYRAFFEGAGAGEFAWVPAPDAASALNWLRRKLPDLVILDWILPDLPGSAVLMAIRRKPRTQGLGVIVVTGRADPEEEVAILEAGADDHLPKPFDDRVLLARLRALARRLARAPDARRRRLSFPGLSWELAGDRCLVGGVRVHLNRKEAELLEIFMARPDRILAPSFLWDRVWGYESERWRHRVVSLVSDLRMKLGPKWGPRLEAHKGKGYLLRTI